MTPAEVTQWGAQFGFAAVVAFLLLRVLVNDVKGQMHEIISALDDVRAELRGTLESNQRLTAQIAAEAQRSREDVIKALRDVR